MITGWSRDRATLRFIVRRYLPWLIGLNLGWEVIQLPLYTIWREGSAASIAFAIAHCTAGDALIGLAALALALLLLRAGPASRWNWRAVCAVVAVLGVGYTAFSEWGNTVLRPAWAYSALMPILTAGGIELGVSPLLQWLVLPPLALHFARLGSPTFAAQARAQPAEEHAEDESPHGQTHQRREK